MRLGLRATSLFPRNTIRYSTLPRNVFIEALAQGSAQEMKAAFEARAKEIRVDGVLRSLLEGLNEIKTSEELANTLRNLRFLSDIILKRNSPAFKNFCLEDRISLQSLINIVEKKLNIVRIESYFTSFKCVQHDKLRAIITESEKILESHPSNVEAHVKLVAARRALHPEFQVAAVRGSPQSASSQIILQRAKENFFETLVFVKKEGKHRVSSTLVDHVLLVSNPDDPKECFSALKIFLAKKNIPNYHAILDPGVEQGARTEVLSVACQDHNDTDPSSRIIFAGPNPIPLKLIGDEWYSNTLADSLKVPVLPGYYGEAQDEDSLLKHANALGLGKRRLLTMKECGNADTPSVKILSERQLRKGIQEIRTRNPQAKIIIQKQYSGSVRIGVQALCGSDGAFYFTQHRSDNLFLGQEDPEIKKNALTIAQAAWTLGYRGVMTIEFLEVGDQKYFSKVDPYASLDYGITALTVGPNLLDARYHLAAGYGVKRFVKEFLESRNINTFGRSTDEMIGIAKRESVVSATPNAPKKSSGALTLWAKKGAILSVVSKEIAGSESLSPSPSKN